MNCYYHAQTAAIGVCKYCQRGLCTDCAAQTGEALACQGRHEGQVQAMETLLQNELQQTRRLGANYLRNTIFYGSVSILFIVFGTSQLRWLGMQAVIYILIGLAFLYAAVANYVESRKYK